MGFLSRERSRNRPETPLSGAIKIVGFCPKNTFRFTGPFHTTIVGEHRFPYGALELMTLRNLICTSFGAN